MKGFFGVPQNDKRWVLSQEINFIGLISMLYKSYNDSI
jgi:hypothetical protein